MSRVGKVPIKIPKGVEVSVDGTMVVVKGLKGLLQQTVSDDIKVEVTDGEVKFSPLSENRETKSKWGLYRVLVNNMMVGVSQGYSKELEIVGVGYKAELKGKALNLNVGLSHQVLIQPLEGAAFTVPVPNKIIVSGINKQAVGQLAAEIRNVRPPEPYKGKGVRYSTEIVRKKAGKTAGATTKA